MRLSGVYKIVNNITGVIYVGSAIDLKKRKTFHFYHLRKNNHCNNYLQKAFNKYASMIKKGILSAFIIKLPMQQKM